MGEVPLYKRRRFDASVFLQARNEWHAFSLCFLIIKEERAGRAGLIGPSQDWYFRRRTDRHAAALPHFSALFFQRATDRDTTMAAMCPPPMEASYYQDLEGGRTHCTGVPRP